MVVEGGAERVVLELSRLVPAAPIYTSFFDAPTFAGRLDPGRVHPWPLQRLFGPSRRFRSFLPFYPLYFERLNLRRHPLVISSSVAFTHAVRAAPSATHISYVYTPLRYAWDLDAYLDRSSFSLPARIAGRTLRPWLKAWDRRTANRPDVVVAISEIVRERIRQHWDRDAEVIYPPVDTNEIQPSVADDGYLLVAARLLAYRRIDLAVEAATRLGRELVVVGDGPELQRLRSLAGPNVRFLGRLDRSTLVDVIARSHAYLLPGIEDFGIAPVEAMAAGKPVIGIRAGGVAETVVDGETGVLFDEQTPDALVAAIERLDALTLDPAAIRSRAELYGTPVFIAKWQALLARLGVDPSLYSAA
jgi:glycosyltransferase involved in cell wall biosynthesis